MKKTFKTAIVLTVLVTLLASPITVCATSISEVIQENTSKVQDNVIENNLESTEPKNAAKSATQTENSNTMSDAVVPEEKNAENTIQNSIVPTNTVEPETAQPEEVAPETTPEEAAQVEADETQQDATPEEAQIDLQADSTPINNASGKLELEIILRLPTEAEFIVALLGNGETVTSKKEKYDDKLYYNFNDLKPGNYTLKVTGQNYLTYTQKVEIGTDVTKIILSNGHDINDALSESKTKYGVIGLGDITDNGTINEADETLMIEKIEANKYEERYDLNKDGKIDIIDLSYIVYNRNKNIESAPIKMLKLAEENVELTGTKITAGKIASIFENNNDSLRLQPQNGQDISTSNPVEITLDLKDNDKTTEAIVITPPKDQSNAIQKGIAEVTYSDENGPLKTINVSIGGAAIAALESINTVKLASTSQDVIRLAQTLSIAKATIQKDGSILIDLGGQIAIKKVTIKVTQTASNKLADIAKVEFLNDMENRIPEPEMDIPENVVATPGSEQFIVSWKKMANVTGYEVEITANGKKEVLPTEANNVTVSNFANGKVKNGTTYTVRVQSVNGDWKSGYSKAVTVTPQANRKPDAPDNLRVTGAYKSLKASWKNMDSTDSYNIYYREYGVGEYIKGAQNITTNSYTITGLKDKTRYQVYVTGNNRMGEGNPSLVSSAETTDVTPPITTNYQLINRPQGEGKTAHIAKVTYPAGNAPTEFAVVDNDYTTSWTHYSWDAGGFNDIDRAPIVEFDKEYKIGKVIVVADEAQSADYFYRKTRYWDANGNVKTISGQCTQKKSSNGKIYYEFEYSEPLMVKKIQLRFALYLANSGTSISISEIKFYEYDETRDEIANLYTDQLGVTLRSDVTEQTIQDLEAKINTIEVESGEYNPKRDIYQRELDTAREILNNQTLKPAIPIDATVSKNYDTHITFSSGLNAYQPLGVVGYAGETILIYVGNQKLKIGDATKLQLVATQYHAESGTWSKAVKNLVVGRNEVEISQIGTIDVEKRRLIVYQLHRKQRCRQK